MDDWLKIIIPLVSVLVPLGGGILAWWLGQKSKLTWEQHIRKEERYKGILLSVTGFHATSQEEDQENKERKDKFIQELRIAWLYCPDDVIRAGNAFLATVATGVQASNEDRDRALAAFVIALRLDLHGETTLTNEDYKNWSST